MTPSPRPRPLALVLVLSLVAGLGAGCPASPPPPQPPRAADASLAMIEASADLDGAIVGRGDAGATIVILMASWCGHCRAQLAQLAELRATHPRLRILGVNYKGHEEYDQRGNAVALRAYLADHVPWLRVVPADDALFRALGRPPFVPMVWVFDRAGALVTRFDRRERAPATRDELVALLGRLGA